MKRYILTGTPGCGKTSIIRALEMTGASVVAEAATDIIAYKQIEGDLAPWEHSDFIDYIVRLQKHRQINMSGDYTRTSLVLGEAPSPRGAGVYTKIHDCDERMKATTPKSKMERVYSDLHFYDRSPICTYALAIYLGFKPSTNLMNEIERIHQHRIYEKRVFFVENLGFITNTDARKISFEDSLRFEQIHLDVYKKFDYECVMVPAAPIMERVDIILKSIENDSEH